MEISAASSAAVMQTPAVSSAATSAVRADTDHDRGSGPAATAQFSAAAMRLAGDADHDGDSK